MKGRTIVISKRRHPNLGGWLDENCQGSTGERGNLAGMRRLYWGCDALVVRYGNVYYCFGKDRGQEMPPHGVYETVTQETADASGHGTQNLYEPPKQGTSGDALRRMRELWDDFSEVPIDDDDRILEGFMHFEAGTDRFAVWHWFDRHCPNGLIRDIISQTL